MQSRAIQNTSGNPVGDWRPDAPDLINMVIEFTCSCQFAQDIARFQEASFTSGSAARLEARMQEYPHRYSVAAVANADGDVELESDRLPSLASAPPLQFDGPGNLWSPETLLVAAIADCFVLTFRGIARASKLSWIRLRCDVEGVLDRVEHVARFTEFLVHATLEIPAGSNEDQARRLLARAEKSCLVTNSMKAAVHLEAEVRIRTA